MSSSDPLNTLCSPTWCPGCGNLAIWAAFKKAAEEKKWDNTNSVMVAGIGCHGHIVNFVNLASFEGLHGRAIPVATGIKLANHKLNVFVFTGDGDCLGEGGNHFLHACRRNHDLTIFLHDNAIYGLTTGQTSPVSPHGFLSKSTPAGNPDEPLRPLSVAISAGATFVARAFAGDIPKLAKLMISANDHPGLAVIDILQTCMTFNKDYTLNFYRENTYELGPDYDPTDKAAALQKALEWGEKKIPLGIIYREEKPSFESQIAQIKEKTLTEVSPAGRNLKDLWEKYS